MNEKYIKGKYILDRDGNPIMVTSAKQWCGFFERTNARCVAKEKAGKSLVSTVFLCIDHGFGKGPPVLWETMVFDGKMDGEIERCAGNLEQAQAMHEEMMKRVCRAEGVKYDP